MRRRFVTCSWCLILSLGEPTRRALCVVYRGNQGLRDHPVQGLGLRPWRSPHLLVPGPGHTPAPTGSSPRPQSKLCSSPPVPWTWASGGEEERPALSPEAGMCPSTSPGVRRYPALKNSPGGDLKAAAPPADTLGSLRVHSSFYNPPRAFGRALLLWQLLRVLAGPGCLAGQEPREARLLKAGGHTAAPPGSLSTRLAVCASRRVLLACSPFSALGGPSLSPPSSQRPPAHLRPVGWRALLCSWVGFCVSLDNVLFL